MARYVKIASLYNNKLIFKSLAGFVVKPSRILSCHSRSYISTWLKLTKVLNTCLLSHTYEIVTAPKNYADRLADKAETNTLVHRF